MLGVKANLDLNLGSAATSCTALGQTPHPAVYTEGYEDPLLQEMRERIRQGASSYSMCVHIVYITDDASEGDRSRGQTTRTVWGRRCTTFRTRKGRHCDGDGGPGIGAL